MARNPGALGRHVRTGLTGHGLPRLHRHTLPGTLLHRSPRRLRSRSRRLGDRPPPTSRGRVRGMRLRRGVVVGLVVRYGVVPAVVDLCVPGRTGSGHLYGRLPLGAYGRPVGVGGRQGEHRARGRFLSGGTFVGGSQGTPASPGRLRVLRGGTVGSGGQRGRQRLLGPLPRGQGTTTVGRGHALRRHRTAQAGPGGRGPGGMLGGRDDGTLGHTGSELEARTGRRTRNRTLGRPPPPPPGTAGPVTRSLSLSRNNGRTRGRTRPLDRTPPPSPGGRRTLGPPGATGLTAAARHLTLQEGVHGGPPGPPPSADGGLLGLLRLSSRGIRSRHRTRPAADRYLQDERAPAHPRHLMRLQHTAVRPYDPADDRLVHGVSPGVRPAHLDPYDLTALRRRHHNGVVHITARRHGRVAGRVDPGDIRDEMRERGGQAGRIDLGLDGRRVDGELHAPRSDQLDGPVDTGGDDGVEHHLRTDDLLTARVDQLIREDVVDELGDPRVPGGQMMEHLVGLGPQLPGVIGGKGRNLPPQLVERPAQGPPEQRQQLLMPPGERLEPVLLALGERGIPVLAGRELFFVLLAQLLELGDVLLAQRGEIGGVLFTEPLQFLSVALVGGGLLLGEAVVRPPVGEGQHRADELVTVAHRRGRQVDRDLLALLRPQHLPAHPVLAPGAQGVGERGLRVRERRAVGARVQHEVVQFASTEIAGPITQYLSGRGIDEHDPPVGVRPHHTLGRGPQNHLGLPLGPRQLGLGVDSPRQIPYDEHQQLVGGVAVAVVGLLSVLQVRAGDLDGELGAVRPAGGHPRRLGPPARIHVIGPPHGPRNELGVELRQQVEQSPPDERGPRRFERLERDGVGIYDGPIGVDQDQRVGKRVQYGCEASSASGWPAAHETLPPCYRTLPTAPAILPTRPRCVTRGSLRAAVALATPDEREVARRSDDDVTRKTTQNASPCVFAPPSRRETFAGPLRHF